MFDDQVVAEGGSADEVGRSAQLYDLGPHGDLQDAFLAPEFSEELKTRLKRRAASRCPPSTVEFR
jgi:hypothetical protein